MVSSVAFCREVRAEKPLLDFVTRRLSSLAEAASQGQAGSRLQGDCGREYDSYVIIV